MSCANLDTYHWNFEVLSYDQIFQWSIHPSMSGEVLNFAIND